MSKKMDLEPYEEVLSKWYRLNKQFLWVNIGVICYSIIFLMSMILSFFWLSHFSCDSGFFMIGSSFLLAGTWIYAMWRYVWISKIESKRYREIENAITPALEVIAREWYGKDWHKALVECIESHFPGDCPLCGAV